MLPIDFDYNYYIDPEIKDVIISLNKLPFIEQTYYCCAGYGKQSLRDQEMYASRRNKSPMHSLTGYFVLEYKTDNPKALLFHEQLLKLCDSLPGPINDESWSYYLKDDDTIDNIKGLWDRVRLIINSFMEET